MHLAINATEIGRQRGGNESYLQGLLQGLSDLAVPPEVTLVLTSTGEKMVRSSPATPFQIAGVGDYRRLPFYLWQQTAVLRRVRPDWYVSTFFLPPVTLCRAAVLVHDLSFRAHPNYFPARISLYMRLLTGLAVRRAERVIALSEFTRQEIARFHPEAAARTAVVYPGVGPQFCPEPGPDEARVLPVYGLKPGYILALGNIHPRKNLARLLQAYETLRGRRASTPPLVWVGLQRWDSAALVRQARAAGVVMPGFIAGADLPALYRGAAMLAYPSLYEGFGLPPLEAMACGTPAIVSNTTSLPEVVGQAALRVNPTDVEGIAGAMARLLDDAPLRRRLRESGLERAREFTWTRTAQRLLACLEDRGGTPAGV
ncbi:MAG: glycosyltransferase family 4 protein [Anaerolineae bacterium]